MELSAPMATILGAVIAMVGVIVGGLLTVWHQRGLEREKAKYGREDAVSKELATAVQQLTVSMASSLHSMCWLTWLATVDSSKLTQDRIDKYEEEQHAILPHLLGHLATTASVDQGLYKKLEEHVRKIFELDVQIGEAGLSFSSDPEKAAQQLAKLHSEMSSLERNLPRSLGGIVGARLRDPSSEITHSR